MDKLHPRCSCHNPSKNSVVRWIFKASHLLIGRRHIAHNKVYHQVGHPLIRCVIVLGLCRCIVHTPTKDRFPELLLIAIPHSHPLLNQWDSIRLKPTINNSSHLLQHLLVRGILALRPCLDLTLVMACR